MTEEDNEDEQLRWETEMQTEDDLASRRLRNTVAMLTTALDVAMKRNPQCTPAEAQLIRSALIIAKEVNAEADAT